MCHRLSLAVICAAALLLAPASAHAGDPLDIPAAAAQNAADQAKAAAAYAAYSAGAGTALGVALARGSSPNITCTKPYIYATQVTPHENVILVEVHQSDHVVATATCADLTGRPFQASIELRIEFCPNRTSLTTCPMTYAGSLNMTTTDSIEGVAVVEAELDAVYPDLHAAVGKVRRAYACVRTSLTGSTCQTYDYSPVYGG